MIPTPPVKFYSYAVIDTAATPTSLVAVALTRQLAREEASKVTDRTGLKVRRAKLTLFET